MTTPRTEYTHPKSIYIHIPFCSRKCGYCDFNAYSGYKSGTKARYVEALCREIALASQQPSEPITTIFFGGGTPTNLSALDIARILQTVHDHFSVENEAEITIEANPSDVDTSYLIGLRESGINRLSFGVQTFNDTLLKTIDRLHTGADAAKAVAMAKAVGFTNISLDLMFALPRQTLSDWDRTLEAAFALEVPHLSIYSLILEEGTPFFARRERGKLVLPSESLEATMFAHTLERTANAGYEQYEISNYAKQGLYSRHNQIYWHNLPYYGFGAGAVSYQNGVRATNIRRPSHYIVAMEAQEDIVAESEQLTDLQTLGETMMLGLRLREGIDLNTVSDRFTLDVEQQYRTVIARHVENGLLEQSENKLRLTHRGIFLANEVMADFLI